MSEQLKTLKDIDAQEQDTYNRDESVTIKDLRAEAIKWIKELEKKNKPSKSLSEVKRWIKHFFNITDEELK